MKKRIFFILLLFSLAAPAFSANHSAVVEEQWQERKNGVVVEDRTKTTRMMIPKPGASKEEVQSIVGGLRRDLLGEEKTRGAFGTLNDNINGAVQSANNAAAEASKLTGAVNSLAGASQDQTRAIENNTATLRSISFWGITGVIAAIILTSLIIIAVVFVLLKRNARQQHSHWNAVNTELNQADSQILKTVIAVSEISEKQSTLEKKLDQSIEMQKIQPYTYRFAVNGRRFERLVQISENGHGRRWVSLHVINGTAEQQTYSEEYSIKKSDKGVLKRYLEILDDMEKIGLKSFDYFSRLPPEKANLAFIQFKVIQEEMRKMNLKEI